MGTSSRLEQIRLSAEKVNKKIQEVAEQVARAIVKISYDSREAILKERKRLEELRKEMHRLLEYARNLREHREKFVKRGYGGKGKKGVKDVEKEKIFATNIYNAKKFFADSVLGHPMSQKAFRDNYWKGLLGFSAGGVDSIIKNFHRTLMECYIINFVYDASINGMKVAIDFDFNKLWAATQAEGRQGSWAHELEFGVAKGGVWFFYDTRWQGSRSGYGFMYTHSGNMKRPGLLKKRSLSSKSPFEWGSGSKKRRVKLLTQFNADSGKKRTVDFAYTTKSGRNKTVSRTLLMSTGGVKQIKIPGKKTPRGSWEKGPFAWVIQPSRFITGTITAVQPKVVKILGANL